MGRKNSPRYEVGHPAIFGHYLSVDELAKLQNWKYAGGDPTFIEGFMNVWWEFAARQVPRHVAPNSITLIGVASTSIALSLILWYMPFLEEAAPRYTYFLIALLLFVYQTCDSVDGKQARRLKASSPLGQIVDHGCDAFTTVFAVFITAGTTRMGWGWPTLILLGLLQMQMFFYTWWDMHFHVYRWCTAGLTGVTEGQLIVIALALMSGLLGPDVFLKTVNECIPVIGGTLGAQKIQFIVSGPFYLILLYMLLADLYEGYVKGPKGTFIQLWASMLHVLSQGIVFFSPYMKYYPVLCALLLISYSSVVALRMLISGATRTPYSVFQWPAIPFYLFNVYIFMIDSTVSLPLLLAILLWAFVYLIDFTVTTIRDICIALNLRCFSLGPRRKE